MSAQMNFDLAAVEENRRLRIFVFGIDGRDPLIDSGFAHARHPQHSPRETDVAGQLFQTRRYVILEHWLQLSRRARKQSNCTTFVFQIKAWRAAIGIWQYLSAVDHHGLPRISL